MEYLTGYKTKPYEVTALGQVIFTDGINNDLQPNQITCEAYGYTYNRATGTCSAFRFNTNLNTNVSNINNRINGAGNSTQLGSNTIQINGTNNTARGFNNNCLINGRENEIANGINNAKVSGVMGRAIRQGEDVLGGGSYNIGAGYTQSSKIQLSFKTTDETPTNLYVQDIVGEYITVQRNSILGLTIYVTRLETGGTSGTLGHFSYRIHRGAVRCDDVGALTIYSHNTQLIAKDGSLGTISVVDSTTASIPSVTLQVEGLADVNNLWTATAYLHELATNIAI